MSKLYLNDKPNKYLTPRSIQKVKYIIKNSLFNQDVVFKSKYQAYYLTQDNEEYHLIIKNKILQANGKFEITYYKSTFKLK